ncbi:MAG: hypothetical protein JXR48_01925 [Candidatus Delongbacteria bacterium]|nr:hypothetical protein [Candidatus Delongbacteria bacterium]
MLKNWSNIKKLKMLSIIIVLFAYISYSFAITDTITKYNESKKLKQELVAAKDAPYNIQIAKMELDSLSKLINTPIDANFQELLLTKITSNQNEKGFVLKELPAQHFYQESDFIVETNKIVLEGSFHSLVTIIHEMEKAFLFSKMASVCFESYQDNKKKTTKLRVTVYYQNIKTLNNEK